MYSETDGALEVCVVLSSKPSTAVSVDFNVVVLGGTATIPSGTSEYHKSYHQFTTFFYQQILILTMEVFCLLLSLLTVIQDSA